MKAYLFSYEAGTASAAGEGVQGEDLHPCEDGEGPGLFNLYYSINKTGVLAEIL